MQIGIIGAGIIGCAIAHELASRGAKVTVFERRGVARGASWASAGVLAPWIEAGHARKRSGVSGAPRATEPGGVQGAPPTEEDPLLEMCARSLALYDDFVDRVRADGGAAFDYARAGTLEAAFTEDQAAALRRTAQALASHGVRAAWLDRHDARALEPALGGGVLGGLRIDEHGFVEMPGLVDAVSVAARMRGAAFHSPVDITKIEPAPAGKVRIHAAGTTHTFDHLVIAAGSWANRLKAGGPSIRPVKGQLVRLKFDAAPATRVLWSEGCYMVPWRDGTLLVGATVEDAGYDERPTAAAVTSLLDAAAALLPATRDAGFVDVRAGLRPAPADGGGLPHIGAAPALANVTIATGHFRNGVLLAPLTAKLVADQLIPAR
ncbi:MAG: FAD-dependent oxidoreductase [Vicinamibacterales bacterium]